MPHTAGPCGCNVHTEYIDTGIGGYDEHHIYYCPIHKAAPELLLVLNGMAKEFKRLSETYEPDESNAEWLAHAHEIITKAEKG